MPETVKVGDAREDEVVKAKRFGSKQRENGVCTKRHHSCPSPPSPKTAHVAGPENKSQSRSPIWIFQCCFGIYLNFQRQKSLKSQCLQHSESKSYQINSIKSWSSIFPTTPKAHTFQFLQKFRLWFYLIFSEKFVQYSRTSTPQVQMPWNQADAPLLLQSFQKRPRTQSEASWFGAFHKYKQNKKTTLLHR